MNKNTPTKPVQKRGRKPKAQGAPDFSHVWKVNFKLNGTEQFVPKSFQIYEGERRKSLPQ